MRPSSLCDSLAWACFWLRYRAELSELKDKGIYRTTQGEAKHRLERSMQADHLNQSLRDRPAM